MKEFLLRDDIALVYPFPKTVKLLVKATDNEVFLIEETDKAKESDVLLAYRKALLYRYKFGIFPKIIIKAKEAEKDTLKLANELGVEVELSNGNNN